MCCPVNNPADYSFRRKCQIVASISLILYFVCSQASLHLHNTAVSLILAALAGAALFTELVSVGLLITKLRDEFQRTLFTRSFIWGTIVTMGFATVWGIVELFTRHAVPHLDVIWIPVILIGTMAGAKLIIFRQYRMDHE